MECTRRMLYKPVFLFQESKFFKMSFKNSKAKLVIAEAYPEDEGIYTCIAKNSSGTATENCDLVCKGKTYAIM
jgi:hypothetical protein